MIVQQPNPLTNSVSVGAALTNKVTATSINPPISYQWRLNGIDLPGTTSNVLKLVDIQATQGGLYTMVATDSAGSVESKPWGIQVDDMFTKITSGAVVSEMDAMCAVWADINNDGWPDLLMTSTSTTTSGSVFMNHGDGTFTKTLPSTLTPVPTGGAICLADIDNDGWLDVVTVGQTKQSLFRNLGNGNFHRLDDSPVSQTNVKSITTAWADYDNDGNIDLFIGSDKNYLFHNVGDGNFTNVPNSVVVGPHTGAQSCAWGDYNNDGYPDLYVCNAPSQRNFLFRNNRDGTFTRITNDPCVMDVANFSGCAWGDYDNDGYLDLFVSAFGPKNFLFHNEKNGTFKKVTTTPISKDSGHSYSSAWVDYDNDGNLDLYVANGGNDFAGVRKDFLYHNLGNGQFVRVLTGSMINEDAWSYSCAWGDYNRDGFQDLFVGNIYETGRNALFKNNGNNNSWLTVLCVGRVSNRAAIGTKIRAKTTIKGIETWQMREISGGSGAGCQPEMTAAFGLGDATNVDTLRIEWPSGIVQQFTNVAVKEFLSIREPAKLSAQFETRNHQVGLSIAGAKGQVYTIERSHNLIEWEPWKKVTNSPASEIMSDSIPAVDSPEYFFYRALEQP